MEINVDVEELHLFDGIAQCANHTINFKIGKSEISDDISLVENELDLLTNTTGQHFFHPKFTHQVFHRDETIKGMKDLSVNIYLSPTTLRPYVYWCCSSYGQQYDDITNILKISFGSDVLFTDRLDFIKFLATEAKSFKLPGSLIKSFKRSVSINQYQPSSFSFDEKRNRTNSKTVAQKNFNVVKIKGDSEYFKKVDRRFQAMF